MAKGKKTGGRNFIKGQIANPKGGVQLPKDVLDAKKMTAVEFARLATSFLHLTKDQLKMRLENPIATMIELLVGGIVARATKEQDYMRAEFLLNRIIGKTKINEDTPQMKPVIITTKDGTRIECGMSEMDREEY